MDWAVELAERLLDRFEDAAAGGFWFTSHDHEPLIQRTKPAYDNAMPAGNGVAAKSLGRLGQLLGEGRWLAAAERALAAHAGILAEHPQAAPTLLMALADYHHPPTTIVLRGSGPALTAWKRLTDESAPARTLVVCLPGEWTELPAQLAKPASDEAVAHVCTGVNCLAPIVRLDDLSAFLRTPALL